MASSNSKVFWNGIYSIPPRKGGDLFRYIRTKLLQPWSVVHFHVLDLCCSPDPYWYFHPSFERQRLHSRQTSSSLLWRRSKWCKKGQPVWKTWHLAGEDNIWDVPLKDIVPQIPYPITWVESAFSSSDPEIHVLWPVQLSRWGILGFYLGRGRWNMFPSVIWYCWDIPGAKWMWTITHDIMVERQCITCLASYEPFVRHEVAEKRHMYETVRARAD